MAIAHSKTGVVRCGIMSDLTLSNSRRDISADLAERLSAYQDERRALEAHIERLNSRLGMLNQAIKGLEVILALEGQDEPSLRKIALTIGESSSGARKIFLGSTGALGKAARELSLSQTSPDTEEWKPQTLPHLLLWLMEEDRTYSLGSLARMAQSKGYDFGDRSPKRTTNTTLLSMRKRGDVEKVPGGGWKRARAES